MYAMAIRFATDLDLGYGIWVQRNLQLSISNACCSCHKSVGCWGNWGDFCHIEEHVAQCRTLTTHTHIGIGAEINESAGSQRQTSGYGGNTPSTCSPLGYLTRCSRFPVRWQRVLQFSACLLPLKAANCSGATKMGANTSMNSKPRNVVALMNWKLAK